jgi:hypothetical protein
VVEEVRLNFYRQEVADHCAMWLALEVVVEA